MWPILASLARYVFFALLTLWAVHAVAFTLITLLPEAFVVAQGFFTLFRVDPLLVTPMLGADRAYTSSLQGMMTFEFGSTLDGVPVVTEIERAIYQSAPRVFAVVLICTFLVIATAFFTPAVTGHPMIGGTFEILVTFPPFFWPIAATAIANVAGISIFLSRSAWQVEFLILISTLIAPAILTCFQSWRIMRRLLGEPFVVTIRAKGVSEFRLRTALLHHLVLELSPAAERVLASVITSLMFTEVFFGAPGFGSLFMRSVERNDENLLMCAVLLIAKMIICIRFFIKAVLRGGSWR